MTDSICTRCGQSGHRASNCPWPVETARVTACMGGWFGKRAACRNYTAPTDNADPAERLCEPGHDGYRESAPIIMHKHAGTWERAGAALMGRAGPFDMVLPV